MGLVHGVPEGGTVWEVPFARSAHAREARFFGEFFLIIFHFEMVENQKKIFMQILPM